MSTDVRIERVEITVHTPDKPLFLTVQQAAAETSLSTSYLRALMQSGQLPHFKGEGRNGRVLVRTDELMAFMEARRVLLPHN